MPIHGKNTGIALAGYDITRWCNEVSSDITVEVAETTAFDEPEGAKTYALGLTDATFSFGAREQNTVDGLRQVIEPIVVAGVAAPFSVGIDRGFHVGRVAVMGQTLDTKIGLSSPIADIAQVSGDLQSDGALDTGLVLSQKALYSATTTGTTVDQISGGTGAAINYHVVQNSRNGNVVVTVQHSTNGSTWVDYDSYTLAGGAIGGVRRIFGGLPLNRYVRMNINLGGSTGTATVRVAIAKRS